MPSDRKEVTEWTELADGTRPSNPHSDPESLSRPRPILMTVTLLLVVITAVAVVTVARIWSAAALPAALLGAVLGLSLTLVSQAWAASIVFADQVRKGLWFAIFPPYMVVYSVRHWNWMWQPTAMFLAGLSLIAASLWLTGARPFKSVEHEATSRLTSIIYGEETAVTLSKSAEIDHIDGLIADVTSTITIIYRQVSAS